MEIGYFFDLCTRAAGIAECAELTEAQRLESRRELLEFLKSSAGEDARQEIEAEAVRKDFTEFFADCPQLSAGTIAVETAELRELLELHASYILSLQQLAGTAVLKAVELGAGAANTKEATSITQ